MVPRHPVRDLLPGNLKLRNEPKAKLRLSRLAPAKGGHVVCWSALLCGRLNGDLKAGLRQIVETYQLEIRLTANQDVLLCNIGTSQRQHPNPVGSPRFEVPEDQLLANMPSPARLYPPADSPSPNRSAFFRMLDRLDAQLRRLEIEKSLLVRMTGCPNGCARPYMAELGLRATGVGTGCGSAAPNLQPGAPTWRNCPSTIWKKP